MMETLHFRIGAALALIVGAVLVGLNMTEIFGHVAAVIISAGTLIGSFFFRTERCAKRGVVINPNQEKAFEEGLKTFGLIVVVGLLVFPGLIAPVFWIGVGHFALCAILY